METIAVALIAATPPTLAALAAFRKVSGVKDSVGDRNGRGAVHCQLARLEDKLDELKEWQIAHLERWHVR